MFRAAGVEDGDSEEVKSAKLKQLFDLPLPEYESKIAAVRNMIHSQNLAR